MNASSAKRTREAEESGHAYRSHTRSVARLRSPLNHSLAVCSRVPSARVLFTELRTLGLELPPSGNTMHFVPHECVLTEHLTTVYLCVLVSQLRGCS